MKSLSEFDADIARKRARLEKNHAIAHALPTCGKIVTWTGEGGWEKDGWTRKPPVERSIDLAPWIVHDPTAYKAAEHVDFRAPDSATGEKGEHVSSTYRAEFVRRYFLAVLDSFEPFMLETVAVKNSKKYASYFPATYDYKTSRDYADAAETARGLFVISVANESRFRSAELEFYADAPGTGPTKVSFGLDSTPFVTHRLHAMGQYISDRGGAAAVRWSFPAKVDVGATELFKYPNADRNSHGVPSGYRMTWLFPTRESVLTILELRGKP